MAKLECFPMNRGGYSTSEVDTGQVWIDGKKIYRKIIEFGALPNASTRRVDHNISNLDAFIRVYGTMYMDRNNSKQWSFLPTANPTQQYNIGLWATPTQVNIKTGDDRTDHTAVVFLEYTKTTT